MPAASGPGALDPGLTPGLVRGGFAPSRGTVGTAGLTTKQDGMGLGLF